MSSKHPYWPDLTDDEGDALQAWFDDTCGDCLEGRCHWGGERSVRAERQARHSHEFADPEYGTCGCARHHSSVLARPYRKAVDAAKEAALAWRAAKKSGEVELAEEP